MEKKKSLVLLLGVLCFAAGNSLRGEILNNQKVLGRQVALGGLYNARTSEFFGGMSFWNHQTILDNKITYPAIHQNSKSFFENNVFDRLSSLDIGAELKLDFLGGLIHVEGAASYLRDGKELETTIRHNIHFESTNHSEVIPANLPKDDHSYCDLTGEDAPTHVVSQVKYGVNAVFVFEKSVSKSESKEKISGELKVVVKSLPSFQIEGDAHIKVDGNVKKWTESLKVKFFGDVILQKQPSTLIDASKVYNEIGEKARENPQPVTYSLIPISYYCSKDDILMNKLDSNIREGAMKILGEMERTEMKIKTLLSTDVAGRFRGIEKALLTYQNDLGKFKTNFMTKLRKLLIKAKMDKTAEGELSNLLQTYKESRFEYGKSRVQLKVMTREIESIDLVTGRESSATYGVADEESGNDNACLFNYENSLFYVLNVLGHNTDYQESAQERWFDRNALIGKAGKLFREFLAFSETNHGPKCCFMVQLKELSPEPVNLVAYKNGQVLTNNFIIPNNPEKVSKKIANIDNVVIGCKMIENKFISRIVVKYQDMNALTDEWNEVERVRNNQVSVSGLKPMTKYKMKMSFKTEIGVSPDSEEIEVTTLMSSPPSNLVVRSLDPFSLEVSYQPPNEISPEITDKVTYEIKCDNKKVQGAQYTYTFSNLTPATKYDISVTASYRKEIVNTENVTVEIEIYKSGPATAKGTTIPRTMKTPTLSSLSANSAIISWVTPEVATGAVIDNFMVIYSRTDNGVENERVTVGPVKSIELGDLAAGVQYEVTVQVRTTAGNSLMSPGKRFTTPWEKTELEQFKDSLGLEGPRGIKSQIESNKKTCDSQIEELKTTTKGEILANQGKIRTLETKTSVLETSVAICGFTQYVTTTGVITYDKLPTSHSSDSSALDMRTGKYRATTSGIYSIAWGGVSYGGRTEIYLHMGHKKIEESLLLSRQAGNAWDMATRTMSVCLSAGQEVYLKPDQVDQEIFRFNFCITLVSPTGTC